MIELAHWLTQSHFANRPWLLLGKGPTFSRRDEFDLETYNRIALNHAVRELHVDIAHIIDIDVVAACADVLAKNAEWLVMPRFPHISCKPDPERALDSFFDSHPVLRDFADRGRLVCYDLRNKTCPVVGEGEPVKVRFFSSEAALEIVGRLGAKTVRSLGIDGGRKYSNSFEDLNKTTLLKNEQPSFDIQFAEIQRIAQSHGMDYESLIPPMRIFVGGDETEQVAAKVLEYTIRKHASGPVDVTIMRDYEIPVPKDPKNRSRTKFSFYRFKIPQLCGHRGRALYIDSDMQVFRDVAELWRIPFGDRKVLCTYQKSPPPAWKDVSSFKPGRQFSVMLLDCDRLPWHIEDVIAGLDKGRYAYADLLFDMCLVEKNEIGEDMPVEWNHLETYVPGQTALTHFTVVPTQPWKTDNTPLNSLWMDAYEEAVAAGAVDPHEVREGIQKGYYKASLAPALSKAPAFWSWTDPDAERPKRGTTTSKELARAASEISRLQHEITEIRQSWTWKLGRLFTKPLDMLSRPGRQSDKSDRELSA
jgi:hypothetical protein